MSENFLQQSYNAYRDAGGDHAMYVVYNDLYDNRKLCEELRTNYEMKKKKEISAKPEIITLCGSTRFKDEFLKVMRRLTLEGKIVIPPGVFGHSDGGEVSEEQKKMLDELHFRKIDISDGIYVIDINGYIGESTRREIEYATKNEKFVRYYSREQEIK